VERHDKSIVALFTVILAVSTIGLWFAVVRLWDAGQRQLKLIRHIADEQSTNMKASISVAERSAIAAQQSADAVVSQLRASVHVVEARINEITNEGSVKATAITENTGRR
jgi:hypothetical protein